MNGAGLPLAAQSRVSVDPKLTFALRGVAMKDGGNETSLELEDAGRTKKSHSRATAES